jgi:hypothetical protein
MKKLLSRALLTAVVKSFKQIAILPVFTKLLFIRASSTGKGSLRLHSVVSALGYSVGEDLALRVTYFLLLANVLQDEVNMTLR